MGLFLQILLAVAIFLLDYFLGPKPKKNKGRQFEDLKDPTASAGRKIPKLYGCKRISGVNVLSFSDKGRHIVQINA